jgi:hypothetical protein
MHVKRIILLNVEDIAEPGPGTEQSADKHGENFGGEEGQSNESKKNGKWMGEILLRMKRNLES